MSPSSSAISSIPPSESLSGTEPRAPFTRSESSAAESSRTRPVLSKAGGWMWAILGRNPKTKASEEGVCHQEPSCPSSSGDSLPDDPAHASKVGSKFSSENVPSDRPKEGNHPQTLGPRGDDVKIQERVQGHGEEPRDPGTYYSFPPYPMEGGSL